MFEDAASADVPAEKIDVFVDTVVENLMVLDLLLYLPGSLEKMYPGAHEKLQTSYPCCEGMCS